MARLFIEHKRRKAQSLDGAWQFCKDVNDCGLAQNWQHGLTDTKIVSVPSMWNNILGELTYEGVAWYQKTFYTDGGCLRLCFGGVMTEAEVFFDGVSVCKHYGGFNQFDCIVPNVTAGEHTIILRVDNRFDSQSLPQQWVDWYHYGGITRSVTVETLEGICILNNRLEYTLADDLQSVTATLVVDLYNAGGKKIKDTVTAQIGEFEKQTLAVTLNANERKSMIFPTQLLQNVALWDVGQPNLYPVSTYTKTDDLYDRVGFRKIEVKDGAVLLNGKKVEFNGVNRHDEHPDWGFACPFHIATRDLDMILQMGCNAIRGSHYPNPQEFVDLLDERGVLFWSEIQIWGSGIYIDVLSDPVVVERGLQMHREMIASYYNHPCIVFWGMHNEILSNTQAGLHMSQVYYDYLKQNGGNRLVVFASNHGLTDICFDYTDVICLNEYHGWYYGYEEGSWEKFMDNMVAYRKQLGMEHKPIIMSEFGTAAMFGHHDDENILWSEENQAKQLRHCLELFHAHPAVAGEFIWQYCDMRTCRQAGINRARGFNNKGLVNEYRKPKLAYHVAKELFHKFKNEK